MDKIKKLLQHDAIKYLIAGVITTVFYLVVRMGLLALTQQPLVSTLLANGLAILVAFALNDVWVFSQARLGWQKRMLKFYTARLSSLGLDFLLTLVFVQTFPQIIGQFVNHDLQSVDAIVALVSQILIMITNYFLSKFLIFKN